MADKTTVIEKDESENSSVKNTTDRTASATWMGSFKLGKGTLSVQSEVLKDVNYSFRTRFEDGEKGTNPEELLAAAHAGCFTMSVAAILSKEGIYPSSLETKASVTIEDLKITKIHLAIVGTIEDITAAEFSEVIKIAEKKCLISNILNIPITCEERLIV